MSALLGIWTVYDHPRDYPQGFIARLHEVHPGYEVATDHVITSPTLAAVRAELEALHLTRIGRAAGDDPVIVESWL